MFGVEITVTVADSECTNFYTVEYKKDFETVYTPYTPNPVPDPLNPLTTTFQLMPLDTCQAYDVRITRRCCNGQNSNIETTSFTTGGCE